MTAPLRRKTNFNLRSEHIDTNQKIKLFHNLYSQHKRIPCSLYWDLKADGIHAEQLAQAIEDGVTLEELYKYSNDILDIGERAYRAEVLQHYRSMGKAEINSHPAITQLLYSI